MAKKTEDASVLAAPPEPRQPVEEHKHEHEEKSTTAADLGPPTVPKVPEVSKETREVKYEKPAEGSVPGSIPPLSNEGDDTAPPSD